MAFIQIILSLTNHKVHGKTGLTGKLGFKDTKEIICVILFILFQRRKGNSIVLTDYKRRDRKGYAEFAENVNTESYGLDILNRERI